LYNVIQQFKSLFSIFVNNVCFDVIDQPLIRYPIFVG